MIDETLDSVSGEDVDEMEEEIQKEVDKVSLNQLFYNSCVLWSTYFYF